MQISCKFYFHYLSIITPLSLLLFIFLNCLTITISSNLPQSFSPTDNILISCGASGYSTSLDGREWTGDIGEKFISSFESNYTTTAFKSSDPSLSIDPVPYKDVRIFRSPLTYTFRVTPGQKFIRLYFNPTTYQGLSRSKAYFSVISGPFSLLSNFSPFLKAQYLGTDSFVKEFCMNVEENQILNITFIPSILNDSYGFINGIEVVSMPTNLYYTGSGGAAIPFIGQHERFNLENNTALEMVHRLNVGGRSILPVNDSGMFRSWSEDTNFVLNLGAILASKSAHINFTKIPAYSAPREVYQTARSIGKGMNLTWKLPVDSGFKYLIRLHFCELEQKINKTGDRQFQIFIGSLIAESSADMITLPGGIGNPVFKDYVVMMPEARAGNKNHLFIALVPKTKSEVPILNGMELFKINNTGDNLGGHNPETSIGPALLKSTEKQVNKKSKNRKTQFIAAIVVAMGGITILLLAGFTIFWHRKRERISKGITEPTPEGICRQFTAEEIRNATNNFDRALVIGNGGFGRVYKGYIDSENTPVAIKILIPTSRQGSREFHAEIEMLSKLRHPHLVSLIGYCNDERLMILVYDYMSHGALRDHLYHTENPPLSWKQRLEICIGAARGIHYLHAGAEHIIIHRDIKSSNILLDEKWVPKVSDFGLSRLGPTSLSRSHVTTDVRGTFGYLDPEYFSTNHLTVKSDVYGFGVLLFEVLCARPAVDTELEEEQHSLAEWARQQVKNGALDQIIDPNLRGEIAPECLQVYAKIAVKCLREQRNERPTISNVLKKLELAMKLQEKFDATAEERSRIDGSQMEQISLCAGPGDTSHLVVHSCPTFWQKTMSHNKELLRFFSEKARIKFSKPPSLRRFKALLFAVSAYRALSRGQRHLPGSNNFDPDLASNNCDLDLTSGNVLIEIKKSEESFISMN